VVKKTSGWLDRLGPNEEARRTMDMHERINAIESAMNALYGYPEFSPVMEELRRMKNELDTKNS
jgi:hypothetical protein